jgi:ABC-type spermidine/putrescine transport system permease subunit I
MKLTAQESAGLEQTADRTLAPALSLAQRARNWWRQNWSTLLLLSPLLLFMLTVFAVPMVFQIAFAFFERELLKGVLWVPKPAFSMVNFIEAFTSPEYRFSIGWTIGIAFLTTTINTTLALPVAYYLARMRVWGRNVIELSFLLPIFGEIFTIYALAYALTPQGPFNWLLLKLHLISEPLSLIGDSPLGVIIWMSLPTLSVLLIRSAFANVDLIYEEAAQTMGASSIRTFFQVTVPLAKRGIAGAFLLGFSGAVGAYTIPLILAGPYNSWLTNKIQREITPYFNYPMASALGVILTLTCAILFFFYLLSQESGGEA